MRSIYPGAQPITSASQATPSPAGCSAPNSRALGAETAKPVDTYAAALFHHMTIQEMSDLDRSYTPPLGSPWDAIQVASQLGNVNTPPTASQR